MNPGLFIETADVPPAHDYKSTVQGRCLKCKVAYRWAKKLGRLKDMRCPRCRGSLYQTAYYLKSVPWRGIKAAGR